MAEITRALTARVGVDLAKQVIRCMQLTRKVDAWWRAFKRDQFVAWSVPRMGWCN